MTRPEAEAIIRAFKSGTQTSALTLQEAIRTTRRKRDNTIRIPELPQVVRERMNAILLFNLGRAMR
jgi:hypothetical protein